MRGCHESHDIIPSGWLSFLSTQNGPFLAISQWVQALVQQPNETCYVYSVPSRVKKHNYHLGIKVSISQRFKHKFGCKDAAMMFHL
jgi:hypothetical protein